MYPSFCLGRRTEALVRSEGVFCGRGGIPLDNALNKCLQTFRLYTADTSPFYSSGDAPPCLDVMTSGCCFYIYKVG